MRAYKAVFGFALTLVVAISSFFIDLHIVSDAEARRYGGSYYRQQSYRNNQAYLQRQQAAQRRQAQAQRQRQMERMRAERQRQQQQMRERQRQIQQQMRERQRIALQKRQQAIEKQRLKQQQRAQQVAQSKKALSNKQRRLLQERRSLKQQRIVKERQDRLRRLRLDREQRARDKKLKSSTSVVALATGYSSPANLIKASKSISSNQYANLSKTKLTKLLEKHRSTASQKLRRLKELKAQAGGGGKGRGGGGKDVGNGDGSGKSGGRGDNGRKEDSGGKGGSNKKYSSKLSRDTGKIYNIKGVGNLDLTRSGVYNFLTRNASRINKKVGTKLGEGRLPPFEVSRDGYNQAIVAIKRTLNNATDVSGPFTAKSSKLTVIDVYSKKTGFTVRVRADGTFDTLITNKTKQAYR